MTTADQLTPLLADAYCAAARSGAAMREATEALEAVRETTTGAGHPFSTWDLLDDHIGQTTGSLQQALIQLRDRFGSLTLEAAVAQQREAFSADPETAWTGWLRAYGQALGEWRLRLCLALANADLPFPPHARRLVELIRQRTPYIRQERWPEAYRLYLALALQDVLPARDRARFYVHAAEIQLFLLYKRRMAKPLLERADRIHPDSAKVSVGWGEYWLVEVAPDNKADADKARRHFEIAIERDPRMASPYSSTGQVYQRQGDLETAERWYREAIRVRPGNSAGYGSLLRLYSEPELLEAHEADLMPLFERAIAAEPEAEYGLCLDLASAYQQSKRFVEARRWLNRAVALDRSNPNGHLSLGHLAREQGELEAARRAFQGAMQIAPEFMDPYWAMAQLHEQQEELEEAIRWYRRCLPCRPSWYAYIHARIGQLLGRLDRPAEAEVELLKVLRADREDDEALANLQSLADRYYQELGDPAAAVRLQQRILDLKGPGSRGAYHNRLGNVRFYYGEYPDAAEQYRLAIAWDPEDPVFHSNLALALDNSEQPGQRLELLDEALPALGRALELDPDNTEYAQRLEQLARERALIAKYEEGVLQVTPYVNPIAAELSEDLVGHLLVPGSGNALAAEAQALIDATRDRLLERFGVRIPGIRFRRMADADLHEGRYSFELMEVPVAAGTVPARMRFFARTHVDLQRRGLTGREQPHPGTGEPGYWVDQLEAAAAGLDGPDLWAVLEYPLRHLEALLEWNLADFLDHQAMDSLLMDEAEGPSGQALREPEQLTVLTQVLRGLLADRVPIKPLQPILDRFLELRRAGTPPWQLLERLRSMPELVARIPGRDAEAGLYLLGPRLTAALRASIRQDQDRAVALLERPVALAALTSLQRAIDREGPVTVAVPDGELRQFAGALVRMVAPRASVLATHQLGPGRAGAATLVDLEEEAPSQDAAPGQAGSVRP